MRYLVGYVIGFASAVPIGPVCVLAFHQRMKHGAGRGFSVAAVASALDMAYFLAGAQAATAVNEVLVRYARVMRIAGALVLFAAAWFLFRESRRFSPSEYEAARLDKRARFSSPHLAAAFFYVTSPTILAFWLAVAGTAVANGWVLPRHPSAVFFALAVGAGSATWYYILMRFILAGASRLRLGFFRTTLFALAVMLAVFGGVSLAASFRPEATARRPAILDRLRLPGGRPAGRAPAQRPAPASGSQR